MKGVDHLGHEEPPPVHRHAHPQPAPDARADLGEVPRHALIILLESLGVLQEQLAPVGQLQGDVPDEQLAAQLLFEGRDAGAQGLLGDEQLLRRLGEAALSRHLQKVVDALEVHGHLTKHKIYLYYIQLLTV